MGSDNVESHRPQTLIYFTLKGKRIMLIIILTFFFPNLKFKNVSNFLRENVL